MEEFESKQYFSEPEEKREGKAEKIEISRKDWKIFEVIAKRVGGDFGMKVKLGESGGGSFFSSEDCSITFDPLDIKDNIERAKFVAGHEGAHELSHLFQRN